jgi:hypothetical protein
MHMLTQRTRDHANGRILVVAGRTVAGAGWVAVGLVAGWLIFATPLLVRAVNLSSGSALAPILGTVAWVAAVTAPTCFILLGTIRLASAATNLRGRTRPFRPVHAMAKRLPAGLLTLPTVRLPDGRAIPDVVLGPYGVAFFEVLPAPASSRHVGSHWEARFVDGGWRPAENPLERAARDGDALRRFLESVDCGFVVRVYPVVTSSARPGAFGAELTGACSVVPLADVPGWLASLRAQRSLSATRIEHIREILESLARA